jgi:tetrahydromethanopterin S-methyltransferase subunit F
MYLALRKTSAKVESLAEEVKTKVLPTIDSAQSLVADIGPKVQVISENLAETTSTVRDQLQRVDAAVNDVIDRARLQVIRADDLLSRTLDRVEATSEIVHRTVVSPVRHVSGIVRGVTAGIEFLVAGRGRRNGSRQNSPRAVPQDEMFI